MAEFSLSGLPPGAAASRAKQLSLGLYSSFQVFLAPGASAPGAFLVFAGMFAKAGMKSGLPADRSERQRGTAKFPFQVLSASGLGLAASTGTEPICGTAFLAEIPRFHCYYQGQDLVVLPG